MALVSCGDSDAYREYEVFNKSVGRFGQNALLEENLLEELQVKKLLRDGITWTKPPAWKEGEAGDFRLAAFLTDDFLEITLVHFPDAAGGIRANINRWAGQVNLAFSPRKISDYINDLVLYKTSSDLPYILINVLDIDENISDENTENVLVAIFLFEDEILFIKMLGGDDQLKKQENDFLNFVASIALKK